MNFLAGISETLCFSREFLRRNVSRGHILKSVFSVGEGVKDNYKKPHKNPNKQMAGLIPLVHVRALVCT